MRHRVFFAAVVVSLLWPSAYANDGSPCGSNQVSVPLVHERTGHVSTMLRFNGADARVLVDTGANVNTLDIEQSRRLNPKVVDGRATMPVAVGSVVLGSQEFSVMDLHFINIPSQRYGTESFVGQLGAKFFFDHKAKLDFENMVMCLAGSAP